MSLPKHEELLPGLHRFEDTCNVYLVCGEGEAIAIDFGSGAWMAMAAALRLPPVRKVFLTHHHSDQCEGLLEHLDSDFEIHAPVGDEALFSEEGLRELHSEAGGMSWFPRSYAPLARGFPAGRVLHDLTGFRDLYWQERRVRFLPTPGHGRHAISIVVDHHGRQLVFCGDAAHEGGTLHQPYHLEWDHWTASGAVAALQGVQCLSGIGMDWLLPSHGPVIRRAPRQQLALLARRLRAFVDAKGSVSPGEKDGYVTPHRFLRCGAMEIVPGLFWFHNGGYLLVSQTGEALITDPHGDLEPLEGLLRELPPVRLSAQLVTHIHGDHMSAVDLVRQRYGAALWLHPWVAAMLGQGGRRDIPYLSRTPVLPDALWPEEGEWTWNEYRFRVAPMPGQTWWHCGFMTEVAGKRVLFGGDTFQPASRWNGTGGFCSINGCRFREGFAATAQKIIDWNPDVIVNGHATWRHFRPSYFQKAIKWAARAEQAVMNLCPSGNLERDYYVHHYLGKAGVY